MQTFLPLSSFAESARVLDEVRLGKQRVEAYQIVRSLDGVTKGWRHHPAVKMWRGYEGALVRYGVAMCDEWLSRGRADTVRDKLRLHARRGRMKLPPWFGDEAFHASHRSNLLRKDPDWYGQFGWAEGPELPYIWPV